MKVQNTSGLEPDRVKIVVAGEAGNGKTTLAKTLQQGLGEKVLVISAEAGLLSLRGTGIDYVELQTREDADGKQVPVPEAERIGRLGEIYEWLLLPEQQTRYKWIFIDSLTEVNQNLLKFLETQEEFQGPKNTIKKFGELSSRMRSLCKGFRDMPHYNVVFSALVKEDTNQDGVKTLKVSMTGAFADQLPALFDEILYLGVTGEKDEHGRNVRMLLTQKTDRIQFPKDRGGALDVVEPADLAAVVRKVRSKPLLPDISAQAKAAHQEAVAAEAKAAETAAVGGAA
jgi:hypothetical protein